MKLAASSVVPGAPDRVFAALTDPEILRRCLPGCESLTPTGPDAYQATLKIGLAGLNGRYFGTAAIRNTRPPSALTLAFEGKGAPGFVRGSADVTLSAEGAATRVDYVGDVQVGGLMAAVGSRLIEAASRKLADDFFRQLARQLEAESENPAEGQNR